MWVGSKICIFFHLYPTWAVCPVREPSQQFHLDDLDTYSIFMNWDHNTLPRDQGPEYFIGPWAGNKCVHACIVNSRNTGFKSNWFPYQ